MIEKSTITCPKCGHYAIEQMPTDACQFFYDCKGCGERLKPKPGDSLLAGPILKERRRLSEEAEARRREEEHRRYQEQERRKTDANQWKRFVEIAEFWRDLEVARQFLSALEARSEEADFTINERSRADWLSWARDKLAAADPLLMGAERIFTDIAEVKSWTYHD